MKTAIGYLTIDTPLPAIPPMTPMGQRVQAIVRDTYELLEVSESHYVIRKRWLFYFSRTVRISKDNPNILEVCVYKSGEA